MPRSGNADRCLSTNSATPVDHDTTGTTGPIESRASQHESRADTSRARDAAARATRPRACTREYDKHRKDRKSARLNSSHGYISYAVFCLKKKRMNTPTNLASR